MTEAEKNDGASRAAGPAITGYMYQFDLTILEILKADTGEQITVEGCEDIDITDGISSESIQCKYLAARKYSLPSIREPVLLMFREFIDGRKCDYRLYVHFGSDGTLPPLQLEIEDLKKCLTEQKRKPPRTILHYMGVQDSVLQEFVDHFSITVGPLFSVQREQARAALANELGGSLKDAMDLHHANALTCVIELAMLPNENDRRITKKDFLARINKRPMLFSRWHQEFLGETKFVRSAQMELKRSGALTPVKRRAVIIDVNGASQGSFLGEAAGAIEALASEGFGLGQLTSANPWTILLDGTDADITAVKAQLAGDGIAFNDGYEGYSFNARLFDLDPVLNTKNGLSKITATSYAVRVVGAETYQKHVDELRAPSTLIGFSKLDPSHCVSDSVLNLVHVPTVRYNQIVSFVRGAR